MKYSRSAHMANRVARLIAAAMPVVLCAQTGPLTVNGVFSSGFYDTWTKGQSNQQVKFVPAGAKFDINGYYLTPDLLTFSVQPELNLGPQASEAGFQDGNGVALRVTALRRRAPLTLRYSNLHIADVYFGTLSQVSAYRLGTRTKELGLTWNFKPAKLPSVTVDWGTGSVGSDSGLVDVPAYASHVQHLNADTKYDWKGWEVAGFSHLQWQQSNLLTPDASHGSSSVRQNLFQLQGSARKSVLEDSELYLDAGHQATSNILLSLPIHLTTNYANANLRLFQRRKWKSAVHAGYSSNVTGQLLSRVLSGVSDGGPGGVLSDTTVLLPFQRALASLNLSGTSIYQFTPNLSVNGRLDRSMIFDPANSGGMNANYFTGSAGINYTRKIGRGSLSAQYGRDLGVGSVTGQSGRISGDNYLLSVQQGSSAGTQLDGTVHGASHTIQNAQPAADRSFAAEGSITQHVVARIGVRAGGGWQRGSFQSGNTDFQTSGYTGRFGLEHPRLQMSASLTSSLGSSLPAYSQLYSDVILSSAVASLVRVVPSDLRALSVTFHSVPVRKLELSAFWTHSLQHLAGVVNNDFEILDAHLIYHFRRINVEAGYTSSSQIFTTFVTYPQTRRGRVYVRFSRQAKLL